jgi:hypothetical protein
MSDKRDAVVDAAMRWSIARQARIDTRKALQAYRAEMGSCEPDDRGVPCYYIRGLALDNWCDVCKGSQPLWLAWRKAAREHGAALRSIAARCTSLRAACNMGDEQTEEKT